MIRMWSHSHSVGGDEVFIRRSSDADMISLHMYAPACVRDSGSPRRDLSTRSTSLSLMLPSVSRFYRCRFCNLRRNSAIRYSSSFLRPRATLRPALCLRKFFVKAYCVISMQAPPFRCNTSRHPVPLGKAKGTVPHVSTSSSAISARDPWMVAPPVSKHRHPPISFTFESLATPALPLTRSLLR